MEINSGNFEEKVIRSDKPILVDFWASWCVPCQMQGPVIEQLDNEVSDFYVGKVNVEEETGLQMKYGISSIPTLLIFKNEKNKKTLMGFHKKEQILQEMAEFID